jgi:GH24 family phage-related lysozyme (muramidase)
MANSINAATVALVELYEGFVPVAANDGFGNLTVGYGHTVGVYPGQTMTQQQAAQVMMSDLAVAGATVTADLPGVVLNNNEWGALASLIFNSGPEDLQGTHLRAVLMDGNIPAAADDLLNFDHANGHVVQGLLNRLEATRLLMLTPDVATSLGWVVIIGETSSSSIDAQLVGGSTGYGPLRAMCDALFPNTAAALSWDRATQQPAWNGVLFGMSESCVSIEGSEWAPIRPFAIWAGLNVSVNGETITLTRPPATA